MNRMKYIMVLDQFGNETPVIFPENLIHKEVAFGIRRACKCTEVIGAGFVQLTDLQGAEFISRTSGKVRHEFKAFGESESLGIKSDKDDSEIINLTFHGHRLR